MVEFHEEGSATNVVTPPRLVNVVNAVNVVNVKFRQNLHQRSTQSDMQFVTDAHILSV